MASVKVINVTKYYGDLAAVNDVSFECEEGEFFSLLGPSGAGKTTTLELIAGLKKLDRGEIYFGGERIDTIPPQERDVAMAFENYALYSHMTVYENVAFPLRSPRRTEKLSPAQERAEVEKITNRLGIGEYLDRMPKQLSGGQKQRVSLARAMVRRPRVFLLDEPIAHLDAKLKALARSDLKRIANEVGTTIIYVTHNYREALALSDRILVLREGRVEQIGTPEQIFNEPAGDFVANLVGDPPINFLDGELSEIDSSLWFLSEDFKFAIPPKDVAKAKEAAFNDGNARRVRIALRPDYLTVSAEKTADATANIEIFVTERKDEDLLLKFHSGGSLLIANTGKARDIYKIGERVWVNMDLDHVHYFAKTLELTQGQRDEHTSTL